MPTLSANKFRITTDTFVTGTYSFNNSDSYRLALCTPAAAPVATDTTWTTGTGTGTAVELSNASGYTQAGVTLAAAALTANGGSGTIIKCANPASPTWTASGTRDIRYFVLWNGTMTSGVSGNLLAWWDYGSTLSLASGDTLDCNASAFATTGWATLA
jgi:hypothetical protein